MTLKMLLYLLVCRVSCFHHGKTLMVVYSTLERGASISDADDAYEPEEFDLPAEDNSPEEFEYPLPADRPLWLGHPWVVADPFIVTKVRLLYPEVIMLLTDDPYDHRT